MARFIPLGSGAAGGGPSLAPAGVLGSPTGLQGLADVDPFNPSGTDEGHSVSFDTGGVFGAPQGLAQAGRDAMAGLKGGVVGAIRGRNAQNATLANQATKAAITALSLAGVPSAPLSALNSLMGAVGGVAHGALTHSGKQVGPVTFNGPAVVDIPTSLRGPSMTLSDTIRGQTDPNASTEPGTPATGLTGLADPTYSTDLDVGLGPTANTGPPGLGPPGMGNLDPTFPTTMPDPSVVFSEPDPTFDAALADALSAAMNAADTTTGDGVSDGGVSDGSGVGAYYHGGPVYGPSGRDQVPGRLTAGEFVLDRDSAQQFGDLAQTLNEWEPGDTMPRGLQGLVARRRG